VSLYRDAAVVLRTQKLGEADRIITLLTRRTGRVRAVAKGVRRTRSRFGARLEPFTHVDLQLYAGRSLDIVTQAETLAPYGEIVAADYGRYTAGSAVLETAVRDWLKKGDTDISEDEAQRRLHTAAANSLGVLASGNSRRAETARDTLRKRLRQRHGR